MVLDPDSQMADELDRLFATALLTQVHPLAGQWDAVATGAELREAQRAMIEGVFDDSVSTRFGPVMRALGLPPASFRNRLIGWGGDRLIAAINFRDPDGQAPFVCFLRSTTPLGTLQHWRELRSKISTSFEEFAPRIAEFFHPNHLPLHAPTRGIDDHLLAAPACNMASRAKLPGVDRIVLRRSTNLDFYPQYRAIYEATYAERPQLKGEVRTEPEENLAICLNDGFLFEILVDGKWAGIIAGKWRTLVAIRSVFMVEIVLAQGVRGQGLGPAIHQLFATAVAEAHPNAVITGTISAKNPWSLKAASRAGRIEIGAWHWIEL